MKILRKINLKNKILNKLILYFTISLVIFSIFLGSLFAYMFVRNTINFNKAILEKRALKIADTISVLWYGDREFRLSKRLSDDPNFQKKDKIYEKRQKFEFEQYTPVLNIKDLETFKNKNLTFENSNLLSSQNDFFEEELMTNEEILDTNKNSQKENNKKNSIESKENKRISENSHHERRRNMKMFEDIAMGEIWFVDAKTGDIIQGHNYSDAPTSYRSLPPNAENAIKESLNGRVNTTENFNEFLDNKSITVAAPIFSKKDNSIVGAVLLHAPVSDISDSLKSGIYTLIISIIIALILSIISAVLLSLSFTKPLSKIQKTALLLKKGNYNVKTEVKQKDEIGELARTMDELSERLYISSKESERFEKMRSDFITNISHELRTPITVIRGSIEAICDGIITDKDKLTEYHKQILSDSIHLQHLVNDLIDLTKLQNPDFSIQKNEINLPVVINDAVRSMRQLAKKKSIQISFTTDNEYYFSGDYQRIRQMIIIIIDNAIKFSDEGKEIKLNLSDHQTFCRLNIQDEGCGISEESLKNIFDRFYKSTDQKNKEGMGLGLNIAQQIAKRHNIKVKATSKLGKGTLFSFDFPYQDLK